MGPISSDLHLPILLLLPAVGAILVMLSPRERTGLIRTLSVGTALVTLAYSIYLAFLLDYDGSFGLLWSRPVVDFGRLKINFALGADGLSMLMILLNALLFAVALVVSLNIEKRVREYHAMFLLLEMGVFGVFAATDLFFFYVFWEIILIPMFLIIAVWGGKERQKAALKFILFTLGGSLFMLVGIIGYYFAGGSFDLTDPVTIAKAKQDILFWLVFIGLAVKVPLFPLHTWLPDAHTEAPTAGSIILAGVLLKMGTSGFLRVLFPLFPDATVFYASLLGAIGVVNIVYGAFLALAARDIKRIIACSSISHMGFVVLALATLSETGFSGATLQMINHGLITGGLFLLVGVIYDRTHRRGLEDFGGLYRVMPFYYGIMLLVTLASIGLPGLNGFVSEFTCLLAAFQVQGFHVMAAIATSGIVLGAVYMLNLIQKVFSGPINEKWSRLEDIDLRESVSILPLSFLIIFLGVAPGPIFKLMSGTMNSLVELIANAGLRLSSYMGG
ncbi:MAG: hypothetical protein DRP90_04380 [Planctomycetota bacterium]|nr:MAG: hypothetical protein DRP90_04380 [Planctomycetota bacterium]